MLRKAETAIEKTRLIEDVGRAMESETSIPKDGYRRKTRVGERVGTVSEILAVVRGK